MYATHTFLGNVLSSRTVSSQVFSAMRSLTSVFGMGTGGAFSLLSPRMVQNTLFKYSDNCIKFFFLILSLLINPFLKLIKPSTYQYQSAPYITALPLLTYQPGGLPGVLLTYVMGYLILRLVSHLDAFSIYPNHTSLLGYAAGATTDSPLVCPSRSSRTRDSPSQISYAHDRQGPNCLTTF